MSSNPFQWASVPEQVLNLDLTLSSGQAFRWRRKPNGEWLGSIGGIAVHLKPGREGFYWRTLPEPNRWDVIDRYFALDVDLRALQSEWMTREPRMEAIVQRFPGLRILRQDGEEVVFAFLCASCNTIAKITRTMHSLECRYGEPIAEVDGEVLWRFPCPSRLAAAKEADLRQMLWGFRTQSVLAVARFLSEAGRRWLNALERQSYREARAQLMKLPGVGRKIADCICLFALGHNDAVPVDTHIRKVAVAMFAPCLAARSLTTRTYEALADAVRERFGAYAGWAQQYLFCYARAGHSVPTMRMHS
ncbi:MAG: DNA glycosylase [Chthonomonadales bacterium]